MTTQLNLDQVRSGTLSDSDKYKPMVQWFSPALLARAGFQSMVANLFGQYADQRVIQHLSDPILSETATAGDSNVFTKLANRYDYSTEAVGGAPFWFDFTADLGDGFDPTYAVCHTISQNALHAENSAKKASEIAIKDWHGEPLPAGRLLVLGGDEVYPYPGHAEYENRFKNPFRLALPENDHADANGNINGARRDLFAIPGNHDWYDGLSAFQDVFMAAEDGPLKRAGQCIGGWQTRQHRSYFAIKLPYNWWIWGADIHLNRSLDEGQLEYFHAIAKTMGPGHKFILCTAQPSWYYFGTSKEPLARENLLGLIDAPIRAGAKLHGIFSGDSHHYARYQESSGKLGNFNLFTVGGGGAYTHGTFHLRPEISFNWIGQKLKFLLNRRLAPGAESDEVLRKPKVTDEPAVYPSKTRSKAIAWASAFMPFRNFSFALAIGFIYLLLTWTFSIITITYDPQVEPVGVAAKTLEELREKSKRLRGLPNTTQRSPVTIDGQSTQPQNADENFGLKTDIIGAQAFRLMYIFRATIKDISKNVTGISYWREVAAAFGILVWQVSDLLLLGLALSPMATAFLLALWVTLIFIAESKFEGRRAVIARTVTGTLHFMAHVIGMWVLFCIFIYIDFGPIEDWFVEEKINRIMGIPLDFWLPFLVLFQMVVIGGMVGGTIFGIYLAIGYRWFKVNADWVFSSQRITRFKCFLRMRFEPDTLTIYPIGIDSVPTRTGPIPAWKWTENPANGEAKLQPKTPIQARLIEGPIVIRSEEVQMLERPPIA